MQNTVLIVLLISIFGAGVGVVVFFLVKSILTPHKISSIADFLKQGKFSQAVKIAKQMLQKDPRNIEVHYLLGQAYEKDNRPELALMEYKTVNSISDFKGYCQEIPFRKSIARLFMHFNNAEEALKEYLLLMNLEPEEADNFYEAGLLFEERNRSKQAAKYYKKAIDTDPTHVGAHFKLGYLLYLAKKHNDASMIFQKAAKLDPHNNKIYFYMGKMQKQVKDHSAAIAFFDRSQKDQEYKVKSIVEKGSCYIAMGNYNKAQTELERAVKLSADKSIKVSKSDLLFARYFLGYCFEAQREIDHAIEQWEFIYKVDPNFKDVAEKLSRYQDLRSDDLVKDYMTVSPEEYYELCKKITHVMGFSVNDLAEVPNGCQIIAVEQDSGQWRNARKMPRLIRFVRTADTIDVQTARNFLEAMKKINVTRGIIVSSANFSRTALEFTESRPIELYGRDQLQSFLSKIKSDQ